MPAPRQQIRLGAQTDDASAFIALSISSLLDRRDWTERAACRDSELDFIIDERASAHSPLSVFLRLVVCAPGVLYAGNVSRTH